MPALRLASLPGAGGAGDVDRSEFHACYASISVSGRPPFGEFLAGLRGRRIKAENAAAFIDLLLHEVLEHGLVEGFIGDGIGDVRRNDHDAFGIADHDVAGNDRDFAAGDRHIEIDGVMLDQIGRRRRMRMIGREGRCRDLRRVAKAAVGDDAGGTALPQPRQQNVAGRGRGMITPAVDDEDMAGRALLDALALRMVAVFEHAEMVEVLARRDIAQRIGRPDHVRHGAALNAMDAGDEGVAEAALEQHRGQRRRGDCFQFGFRAVAHNFTSLESVDVSLVLFGPMLSRVVNYPLCVPGSSR